MEPTRAFRLSIQRVNATDKDTVTAFYVSTKGPFDSTWDITIPGYGTFTDMRFTGPLEWQEGPANRFTTSIEIRQVKG